MSDSASTEDVGMESLKTFMIIIGLIVAMNLFTIIYICCSLRRSAAKETKAKYRYETDIDDIAEDIIFMDQ